MSRTQLQQVAVKRRPQARNDQGLLMLLFESLSAGAVAVFILISALLAAVGLYTIIVWPLTKWDLANINPEKLRRSLDYVLTAIFVAGTATGLWCFSGAAFRGRKRSTRLSTPGLARN